MKFVRKYLDSLDAITDATKDIPNVFLICMNMKPTLLKKNLRED